MDLIAQQEAEHKAKLAAAQKKIDDRAAYRKRLREQLNMGSLTTKVCARCTPLCWTTIKC